jgi:hypothetical protein
VVSFSEPRFECSEIFHLEVVAARRSTPICHDALLPEASPRLAAVRCAFLTEGVNRVQRLRIRKARRQLTPDRDVERPGILVISLVPDSRCQ